MSINEIKNSPPQPRPTSEGRGAPENTAVRSDGGTPGGKGGGAGNDRVTLSKAATHLSELARTVSEQPVVDSKRVGEIRQAIQEGRYEVNAESTAAKLIAAEMGLAKGI